MNARRKRAKPPRLGKWLLESFCSYDFLSTARWDLEELFTANVATKGVFKAKFIYLMEVFSIIIYLFSKGKSLYSINTIAMLKHNILISIRGFKRFKSTFFINLFGLASGLASAILIYLWIADEMKVDSFHKNDDRLYQVMQNNQRPNGIHTNWRTPIPLAQSFEMDLPEVDFALALRRGSEGIATVGDTHIKTEVLLAGNQFFNLFSFPLQQGNQDRVFTDSKSVAISTDLAERLFGSSDNVIGKSIEVKHYAYKGLMEISAVFEKVPFNSTLKFDMVLDIELFTSANEWVIDWNGDEAETFVLLAEGADIDAFNGKIQGWLEQKEPVDRKGSELFLQKYSDRYLYGDYQGGKPVAGRAKYTQLFSTIAIFIVLIACINFINLSTAQATQKMKEIGVKKALGSNRSALVNQLLTETIVMSFISLFIALGVVALLLPGFNELVSKNLALQFNLVDSLVILGLTLIVGISAGSYPAFYISGFKPIAILKGSAFGISKSKSISETLIRKALVIFQFSISLIFVIAFMVINQQITFVQTTDIGYDRDDLIHFKMKGGYGYTPKTFIAALENISGVVSATNMTQGTIVGNPGQGGGFTWDGQTPEQEISFGRPQVGAGFIETLGIELLEGRDFSNAFGDESSKLIINKATADLMGFDNVVGQIVMDSDEPKQIIGVVANFNIHSLRENIKPTFIRYSPNGGSVMLRLTDGAEQATISRIQNYYEEIHADIPFEFEFIDQQYNDLYQAETRVARLSTYFTAIAIIVSCLGIFGLASFTVRKRRKEIAIRKLHGSFIGAIVFLLSFEFIKVIAISIIIGVPVSYFLMQSWLEGFAFSIDLAPKYFIVAATLMILVAWITVMSQTAKSAKVNIAESLRSE
ncbi:MAG: ABC transporter permease [Bacteroidota bacterium]